MKGKNILIVAPHADDEVIGCGGSLMKLKKHNNITIALATEPRISNLEELCWRYNFNIMFLNAGADQQLHLQSHSYIIDKLRETIKRYKIDTVFMPYLHDANEDHKIMAECTNIACRPYDSGVETLLMYEIPETTQLTSIPFTPNYFIEYTWYKKSILLSYYLDELKEGNFPRNHENLKTIGKYRGTQCGRTHAEAFQLVRTIK